MKRDMDLIRMIILGARETPNGSPLMGVPGVADETFAEHVQILEEAGLLFAAIAPKGMQPAKKAAVWRLTWAGHDFADSILDDTIWNKAKEHVIKPSASWTFGVLLEYLKVEIRRHIPGLD